MTLYYLIIIFLVICLHVYYDYISSLVSLSLYSSMESYSAHVDGHYMGDKQCVNVVFIQRLSAIAPYIPGSVVDRGCDHAIESFVVHPPSIGLVELYYYGRLVSFLIFLSNVHHV
jgi:hypothetical protein